MNVTDEVEQCIALLERLQAEQPLLFGLDPEQRRRLLIAAGRLSRPSKEAQQQAARERHRQRRDEKRARLQQALERTGIRTQRREAAVRAQHTYAGKAPVALLSASQPAAMTAEQTRAPESSPATLNCYICKSDFTELHHFYDALCPPCAAFNWGKRSELADLAGRVAIVTGGRVKIGFECGLKMLRSGAHVVVTTRFARDAARRYAAARDFAEWGDRLQVYGLDLRHTPSVEAFCRHMAQGYERLDFVINNACQTVRRPPGFYAHLMEAEAVPTEADQLLLASSPDPSRLSLVPLIEGDLEVGDSLFPAGQLDGDMQQVDLRTNNSWRLGLAEVSSVELLEVQLVNAVAPFVLSSKLKPLMQCSGMRDNHIVHVSAMEGQFYRSFKTDRHPHTNMAKAALNMMTRTSAADYVKVGIHMNSVDTGWITDEDPAMLAERKRVEQGFHPPLDNVDAAARVCDPIIDGNRTGKHVWGQFLKDFAPTPW